MGIADAPEISQAYNEIRNDKLTTNWAKFVYAEGQPDNLVVEAKGQGGLPEFTASLKDDEAAFGFIRVIISNDEMSQRAKFVFVSWVGPKVKVMRKAKISVHLAEVKKVIKSFAIEVSASHKNELQEHDIIQRLKQAGGANYDAQSSS